MKGLIISAVSLGALAYGGSKAYLHSEVGDAMDMAVLMMSPYADIEYSGVRSTMSGELTIEDIRINLHDYRDAIEIDRVGIDTPSFLYLIKMSDYMSMQTNGLPDSFGFLIKGLHVATDADYYDDLYAMGETMRETAAEENTTTMCTGKYGFSPATLQDLGYDEQVFSMSVSVNNDGGQFNLDVATDIEEMWSVEANLSLAGDLMTELMKGTAYRPRLRDMTIDYTDLSLNDRVREHCGSLGMTDEEITAAQVDAFQFYGESNGIIFDEYLMDPYVEFLNGKSRIRITAKPNEPIAMSQIDLYKASDVPALLNLEAQAY